MREVDEDYPDGHWEFTEDDECPFCGTLLEAVEVYNDCDDQEIFCPECGYVAGVE